jgi:hypothetical protein
MADWKFKMRDDQLSTLIQCLDYLVACHGERIRSSHVTGVDQFAHEVSRERICEIRAHLADVAGIG